MNARAHSLHVIKEDFFLSCLFSIFKHLYNITFVTCVEIPLCTKTRSFQSIPLKLVGADRFVPNSGNKGLHNIVK